MSLGTPENSAIQKLSIIIIIIIIITFLPGLVVGGPETGFLIFILYF